MFSLKDDFLRTRHLIDFDISNVECRIIVVVVYRHGKNQNKY